MRYALVFALLGVAFGLLAFQTAAADLGPLGWSLVALETDGAIGLLTLARRGAAGV